MGRCHDMDTIMAAAMELRGEPVRFVFIGDGAKRQQCVELAQRLQLSNCPVVLPYQPRQNLPYSLNGLRPQPGKH